MGRSCTLAYVGGMIELVHEPLCLCSQSTIMPVDGLPIGSKSRFRLGPQG